jgi:hypothetical protein
MAKAIPMTAPTAPPITPGEGPLLSGLGEGATTIRTKQRALPVTVAVAAKGTLDPVVDDADGDEDAALVDDESEMVGI